MNQNKKVDIPQIFDLLISLLKDTNNNSLAKIVKALKIVFLKENR